MLLLTTERMKKRRKPPAGSSTHWLAVLIQADVLEQAGLAPTYLAQVVRPRFCSTSECAASAAGVRHATGMHARKCMHHGCSMQGSPSLAAEGSWQWERPHLQSDRHSN